MLTIVGLTKTYNNGVRALDGIDLEIPRGMFGLLGPNGAGKSSFMRTLATLQDADAGSAFLGEINLLNDKSSARAVLGYLPQDFGLYPQMRAAELLDHLAVLKGVSNSKVRRERVQEMLELTNLIEKRNEAVGTFSGGMRQRFGIAQALIASPELLIVDEPTAGLDPAERNRFHNLLVKVSGNMVVILSTHIVEDVGDLCPNMAIMNRGTVLSNGTPSELKAALHGKVWSKRVSQHEAESAKQQMRVISTRLCEGVSEIHVLSDSSPGSGFMSVSPDLEDVYFAALHCDARQARHSQPAKM